jgi:hypothetical protein
MPKNARVRCSCGACDNALGTEILKCGNREQCGFKIITNANNHHIKVRNALRFQGFFFGRI